MIHFEKCWTGRRWIDIGSGWFAVGFGPRRLIERIFIGKRLVWASK